MKKQYKVWMQTEHTSNSWFHSTEIEKHEFSSKKEAEKCYKKAVSDMKLSGSSPRPFPCITIGPK